MMNDLYTKHRASLACAVPIVMKLRLSRRISQTSVTIQVRLIMRQIPMLDWAKAGL